jgi:hypothetical protein
MGTSAQADFKGVIARHKSPSVYRSSAGWFTVTAYSEIPSSGGIVIPVSLSRTTAQMIFCGPPAVNDALHERSSLSRVLKNGLGQNSAFSLFLLPEA